MSEIKAEPGPQRILTKQWLATQHQIKLDRPARSPEGHRPCQLQASPRCWTQQKAFGYTQEDLEIPACRPNGCQNRAKTRHRLHGQPTRPSRPRCRNKSKPLYTYFKQNLCPSDQSADRSSIREELVMSARRLLLAQRPNLLDLEGTSGLKRLEVSQPILSNDAHPDR